MATTRPTTARDDDDEVRPTLGQGQRAGGATLTLPLASGGTLHFAATVNILQLSAEDRTFLFELIDRLHAYEKAQEEQAAAKVAAGQPSA